MLLLFNYFLSLHHHNAVIPRQEAKFSAHSCGLVLIYHIPVKTRLLSAFVWVASGDVIYSFLAALGPDHAHKHLLTKHLLFHLRELIP